MKILAFADTQGNIALVENIARTAKAEDVDFIVCAGDLCDWGEDIDKLLKILRSAGKPLIMVPGNHEDMIEYKKHVKIFDDFLLDLNKKTYIVGEYCFFGYGEGVFDVVDEKFEHMSEKFFKLKKRYKRLIMITHAPPFNTGLDLIPGLGHVGSKSYRKAIKKLKPDLYICGHIDEAGGVIDSIGSSLLINPGPIGKIIEV